MHFEEGRSPSRGQNRQPDPVHKALFVFGLIAPMITFVVAVSGLTVYQKTVGLIAMIASYLMICAYLFQRARGNDRLQTTDDHDFADVPKAKEGDDPMLALEDASQFFGSSLRPADMFRLVSSRVNDIYPFAASALFVPDTESLVLHVSHAYGQSPETIEKFTGEKTAGLAGMAFLSGEVEIDPQLEIETALRDTADLVGFRSAVAIPLTHEGSVFGVFQMYLADQPSNNDEERALLETIGDRISPLFLSSRAFERTVSNALTDPLTELPNERALYMVLENQLAESQRFRDERPLSVLSVDIKGFDETNQQYGHSTGDRLLRFAGATIRSSLRKMDFLARSVNDEFAVVLPTATEKTAAEVIERIKAEFADTSFQLSDHEEVKLWLNFGWATFWKDGESAEQLLQSARLRKQQSKSEDPNNVLWFKKEYVN
ncbi:MAG: GGDEF domain-containing protein [Blastocatellia bacterium]|nr:GGDEF domain-containing protein [Blastocatellia bacterium]